MLVYLDRTFCPFNLCKKFNSCERAFTEEHRQRAVEVGLPVAKYSEPPECYEQVELGGEE